MHTLRLSEDIRPVTDLKAHSAELVRQAEAGYPVVLSRHGRAVAVLLSVAAFESLQAAADRAALQRAVSEADAELDAGLGLRHDVVRQQMMAALDDESR